MKICHRKACSNTGVPGVTETHRRGRACFAVSWRPARRVRANTTIYFTAMTRDLALEAAIELRRRKIAERAAAEGVVRP